MITAENYPPRFDRIYRCGYIIQVLGIFLHLVGQYYIVSAIATSFDFGIGLFTFGVLLSAWFLLVWDLRIKLIIICAAWFGLSVWGTGYLLQSPAYSFIWPFGFGLVAISAAGLNGKEAYCFQIREGWLLLGLYPVLTLLWFFCSLGYESIYSLFLGAKILWFLLALSFTVRKLRKKIMSCQAGKCTVEA